MFVMHLQQCFYCTFVIAFYSTFVHFNSKLSLYISLHVSTQYRTEQCHPSSQYFIYQEHSKNARNSKYSIYCLPRLKTEFARKGTKIFSEPPLAAKMFDNALAFRKIINNLCNIISYKQLYS